MHVDTEPFIYVIVIARDKTTRFIALLVLLILSYTHTHNTDRKYVIYTHMTKKDSTIGSCWIHVVDRYVNIRKQRLPRPDPLQIF